MIETSIKYFYILITAFYFFSKLLNLKTSLRKYFINVIYSLLLCIIISIIKIYAPHLTTFVLLFSAYIQANIEYNTSIKITLSTTLLSIGFSYFTFAIATFVISPFSILVQSLITIDNVYFPIHMSLTGLFQFSLSYIIFKIKRLKNGMPFLLQKVPISIGIFITCLILLSNFLLTVFDNNASMYSFLIIICTITSFILFIWWRKQLSVTYINRAHNAEIERLQSELDKLHQDNERLGSIIHKDNKLIPAMIIAVQNALSTQTSNNLNQKALLEPILKELELLATERSILTTNQIEAQFSIPSSSITRLDMMLKFMSQKAEKFDIKLTIDFHVKANDMISEDFTEDALVTIVADLVENAIIATKLSSITKEIYIDFTKNNNNYCINVYDTGIPFEPYTIKYAGIKKASTHLDNGGSGIGLMSTFTLLKDSYSSFVIDETIDKDNYTKKVAIVMDRLNEYRVYTQRPDILALRTSNPNITFCS